jgi:hypothetical protein
MNDVPIALIWLGYGVCLLVGLMFGYAAGIATSLTREVEERVDFKRARDSLSSTIREYDRASVGGEAEAAALYATIDHARNLVAELRKRWGA